MPNIVDRCRKAAYRFSLFLIAGLMPAAVTAADSLLIRDVYLISPEAKVSASPVNVLIEEGRIRAIGTEVYPATQTLQGERQYLIPGLIDTHVHLQGVPGMVEGKHTESALYQQALARIPRSYLYFGFTSLLDLASTGDEIASWNSQPIAPQAQFCSPILIPGGYPLALMPESSRQSANTHLLDDRHSHPNSSPPASHSPSELIANAKSQHARCVKVFYETGFGPMRDLPVPSERIIREVVSAAHDNSLPVYLHGTSASAYEFGLRTGVDMVVHGLWNPEDLTEQQVNKLAQRVAKAGIAVQPTIQVLIGEQELLNPDFFDHPDTRAAIPSELLAWYQTDAGQWMTHRIAEGVGAPKGATASERYQQAQVTYEPIISSVMGFSRQLITHQGRLVFGSDTPSGPIYTQFPGLNGRREIQRWHELGVELPDIFQALTINNARLLRQHDLGSVAPGKVANLLLLNKNPLTSIDAYDSISWVILKGTPIPRDSLASAPVKRQ